MLSLRKHNWAVLGGRGREEYVSAGRVGNVRDTSSFFVRHRPAESAPGRAKKTQVCLHVSAPVGAMSVPCAAAGGVGWPGLRG